MRLIHLTKLGFITCLPIVQDGIILLILVKSYFTAYTGTFFNMSRKRPGVHKRGRAQIKGAGTGWGRQGPAPSYFIVLVGKALSAVNGPVASCDNFLLVPRSQPTCWHITYLCVQQLYSKLCATESAKVHASLWTVFHMISVYYRFCIEGAQGP